jgi:DNA-binding SARP family transcriptional activator
VAIGGGKQRALLALLVVLQRGAVDRLIESLWDGRRPRRPRRASRSTCPSCARCSTTTACAPDRRAYDLRIDPGELDADRFESLLGDGRRVLAEGDPAVAAERLR